MEETGNLLRLSGTLESPPVYGHEVFSEQFFYASLSVPRLSGAEDVLPITISERLMETLDLGPGTPLSMEGQLRSYNKVVEGAGRLLITGFVQRLLGPEEVQNPNQVQLYGALCKAPSYRTTPFGREICDLMLAVNRAYGKSDYIPCITWGRTARFASHLQVGDHVQIQGRFQSRAYQKQLADGTILNKTAYEVSVGRLTLIKPGRQDEEEMPLPDGIAFQASQELL
jgi:single-stranded DNA-binding protein